MLYFEKPFQPNCPVHHTLINGLGGGGILNWMVKERTGDGWMSPWSSHKNWVTVSPIQTPYDRSALGQEEPPALYREEMAYCYIVKDGDIAKVAMSNIKWPVLGKRGNLFCDSVPQNACSECSSVDFWYFN